MVQREPPVVFLPINLEQEVRELASDGQTMRAIHRLTAALGCSEQAARDWLDQYVIYPWRWSGGPCPYCGQKLRTHRAQQCFACGRDWHTGTTEPRRPG
jgi:hypothetical protein